jgi:hypothetical protein
LGPVHRLSSNWRSQNSTTVWRRRHRQRRSGPTVVSCRTSRRHSTSLLQWKRVSRPAGLHHRPLAEPDGNLSAHPAPIKQTRQSNGLSVARIEVLLFPVASVMRPLDPTPSLQPHYELSSLLRVGPPQCSASVRSPHGFGRLGFSLHIGATGSCSSTRQPASASRPLYADRRPLRRQASSGLVPGEPYTPGFDDS